MSIKLTQKERMLIEDQKKQEELCAIKYNAFAGQARDLELKDLFTQFATEEQNHFDTLDQMLQGKEPSMSQSQQQKASTKQNAGLQSAVANEDDDVLCQDLLADEKFVSSTYDTAVFEMVNPAVRQEIQHIQQEEQQHGEQLFNYMNSHGMYDVK